MLQKLTSDQLDEYVRTHPNKVIEAFSEVNKPGLTTRDVIQLLAGTNRRRETCRFIRQLLTAHRNGQAHLFQVKEIP